MADIRRAGRGKAIDEAPIKHTAGGEMPDPNERTRFEETDFEDIGEPVEGKGASLRDRLPLFALAVGLGAGLFLLFRNSDRLRDFYGRKFKEKGEATEEGKRAMDVDNVPPSRLMGA